MYVISTVKSRHGIKLKHQGINYLAANQIIQPFSQHQCRQATINNAICYMLEPFCI